MTDGIGMPGAMRVARIWLIGGGIALLAIGGAVMLADVSIARYPALIAWLAAAIILHDGVAAMGVFVATVLARKVLRGIPFVAVAILEAGAAVALIVSLLVVPEILTQASGTANPSILPLDYGTNLLLFLTAIAAATVFLAVAVAVIARLRAPAARAH